MASLVHSMEALHVVTAESSKRSHLQLLYVMSTLHTYIQGATTTMPLFELYRSYNFISLTKERMDVRQNYVAVTPCEESSHGWIHGAMINLGACMPLAHNTVLRESVVVEA